MTIIDRGETFILKTAYVKGDDIETQGLFVAIKNVDLANQMGLYLQIPLQNRPGSFTQWMVNNKAIAPVKTRMITATRTHSDEPYVYDSEPLSAVIKHDGRGNFNDSDKN